MSGPGRANLGTRSGGNREPNHTKGTLNSQTAPPKPKKLTSRETGREKTEQPIKGTGGRS